jgi:hypothetical protein
MAFYKNVLVCKRELMQLKDSLLKINPKLKIPAPKVAKSKHVCYKCGFYFEEVYDLKAHLCHKAEVKCPHCLYRFTPLSNRTRANAQK